MNFLAGISMGRWFGIRVELSYVFLFYAAMQILSSSSPQWAAGIMALLFGVVLLHEFGHCFACRAVKGQAEHIVLWPLGGLAMCNPPARPWPQLITTAGGPLVNVLLGAVCLGVLYYLVPVLPFGSQAREIALFLGDWGLWINMALLLFNLLPVYPMDGGRMVQEVLWFFLGYGRSLLVAGMIGTVGGMALVAMGLGLAQIAIPVPFYDEPYFLAEQGRFRPTMAVIGLLAAMQSFMAYRQAQQILGWEKRR